MLNDTAVATVSDEAIVPASDVATGVVWKDDVSLDVMAPVSVVLNVA